MTTGMAPKLDADVEHTAAANDVYIARRSTRKHRQWLFQVVGIVAVLSLLGTRVRVGYDSPIRTADFSSEAEAVKARCENLKLTPGPPPDFISRTSSDRFVPGTKATLIRNATIWTGNDAGREIVKGDVVIDQGLIKIIAVDIDPKQMNMDKLSLEVIDAEGGWVTPGYAYLNRLGVLATSAYSSLVSSICIHIWALIPFQSFPEQATAIHAKELFSRGCVPLMVLIPMMKHTNSQSLAD